MKSLYELCQVRQDVFLDNQQDDALDLANLVDGSIDAKKFFSENYITEGMNTLVDMAFQRFSGTGARGLIRLKQSMGGGKTHNMIALALLAKYPALREAVPANIIHDFKDEVRVVSYTGRNSDIKYGIWGEIAEQLGKKEAFKDYYAPLAAPGQNAWIELLKGAPLLIVLDELPPYLSYLKTQPSGTGTVADITVTALANLFNAVNKGGELAKVCIVVSDLNATYESGSDLLQNTFKDLDNEISRTSMDIEPVRATSDDLYKILKKKLFSSLPEKAEIEAVAAEYKEAVSKARQMNYTGYDVNSVYTGICEVYPFHPCIKDLFARFKENNNFQQTRGFIRLTRLMVRSLFGNEGKKAKEKYLINAFDFDLHDNLTVSMVSAIKPKLQLAMSRDIVSEGRAAAEVIDARTGSHDMQEIAKMILMASLGDVTGVILGLTANEIIGYMVAPGRDMSNFRNLIEEFNNAAWYLYADERGHLYFRDIQNVNAKLNSIVTSYNNAQAKQEIKKVLQDKFSPRVKDCYQKVNVFPAIDEIQLNKNQVTLVLFEPVDNGKFPKELIDFYNNAVYKNRIMFLSGQKNTMESLLEVSKEYKAIMSIIQELQAEHISEKDTQYMAAESLRDRILMRMRSAMTETFVTLYYPAKDTLRSKEITMDFRSNNFDPEAQIRNLLMEAGKFTTQEKLFEDTFRKKIEKRLFTANKMSWHDLVERAATNMSWNWYIPSGLEDAKDRYVVNGIWAEEGGMLDKEPPAPKTGVSVRAKYMEDGTVLLNIIPENGDIVYWEVEQQATTASARVKDCSAFQTDEMLLYFLCVDSTEVHETGDLCRWENNVKVQYSYYDQGGRKYCCLKATNPKVRIYYTTDGSNPDKETAAVYQEPFVVTKEMSMLQAVAYYEKEDIWGEVLSQMLPRLDGGHETGCGGDVEIQPDKPLCLQKNFSYNSNKDVYELLVNMKKWQLQADVERILVSDANDDSIFVEFSASGVRLDGTAIEKQLENIRQNVLGLEKTKHTVELSGLWFESGRDFSKWVGERREEIKKYGEAIRQ